MVCKNRDTYGFLGTSWVLITMDSRKLQYDEPDLPSSSSAHSSSCCPHRCSRRPLPVLSVEPFKLHHAAPPPLREFVRTSPRTKHIGMSSQHRRLPRVIFSTKQSSKRRAMLSIERSQRVLSKATVFVVFARY